VARRHQAAAAGSIAANGDELWAREEIAIPAPGENPEFTLSGTLTFTGGTGRFRDASGSATLTGGGSGGEGPIFVRSGARFR
jgi:hypothetical protein